ncbi:MAG TPA: secondary thiamine-phosphate synthase enzyme YjbQ [Blastocatellia bacterium]|nr:secondary thiamine-phosphate synthase enzyme YjbQ [Blastocatellia bacterium]
MLITFPTRQAKPAGFQSFHHQIRLHTDECLQFIDLTDKIIALARESGITNGFVNVQTRHTTTAIIVNEHEPLLLEDLKSALERMAPRNAAYRHDDFEIRTANLTPDEKPNGHAHCKALFLGASETLNIANGELQLGRWQRIFLIELDCARERTVSVLLMGQAG